MHRLASIPVSTLCFEMHAMCNLSTPSLSQSAYLTEIAARLAGIVRLFFDFIFVIHLFSPPTSDHRFITQFFDLSIHRPSIDRPSMDRCIQRSMDEFIDPWMHRRSTGFIITKAAGGMVVVSSALSHAPAPNRARA